MISLETQHFNLSRILLLTIGLWPYERSKFVLFQQIILFGILTSFVAFQFTVFLTTKCTINFIIRILSFILFFIAFIIKYNSFWINSQSVKNFLEELKHVCNDLKDENEINVMKKYGKNTESYTAKIILITVISTVSIIFASIWPLILDIILPKNESRPHLAMHIMTEYFIDQEKYYYLILFHMNAAFCIGAITMIATGTMLIGYLKHACGMFRIASYRFEKAMIINNLQNRFDNEIIIYKGIIYAVNVHRKALQFSKSLISCFEGSFFFLIAVGVLNLSFNLCRIFQIVSFGGNKEEFILHLITITVTLLYMFLANYAGQEITDHNNHVFFTVYNVRWYIAPLHVQKLILFLLQIGNKAFGLNVGGLFVASLNCFASLMSASISYFTVMYSTQQ
ncbi:hypothetical protein P5V15_008194 [Pogonomyrmex californicus]